MSTILKSSRGRPREFDPKAAVAAGQRMFHSRGYEAIGLAALTEALGISPPSFYAAFGSKARYFERVLERYAESVLPLGDILLPERSPDVALTDLLDRAAKTYALDPECLGCLVLEAARGHVNNESVALARCVAEAKRATIWAFIAVTHADRADDVTDYVASVMSGLSASAREGFGETRLIKIAAAAALGLKRLLNGRRP